MSKKTRFLKRFRQKAANQWRLAMEHNEPAQEWHWLVEDATRLLRYSNAYPGLVGWDDIEKMLGPAYPRLLGKKR